MVSARTRRILPRVGWVYVAYHTLIATVLVVSAIHDINPGSWQRAEFQLEMLFVVLMFPALIPALFVCGGLHAHCETVLGHTVQIAVFLTTAVCYLMGCWVLASHIVRRFRRRSEGRGGE